MTLHFKDHRVDHLARFYLAKQWDVMCTLKKVGQMNLQVA